MGVNLQAGLVPKFLKLENSNTYMSVQQNSHS